MDDGDSKQKTTRNKTINTIQRYIANVSNVLSPIWVRRPIQINNGHQWIILGSRYRFLFYFRVFLVILYCAYQIFKN
jgi:hypothetical protein